MLYRLYKNIDPQQMLMMGRQIICQTEEPWAGFYSLFLFPAVLFAVMCHQITYLGQLYRTCSILLRRIQSVTEQTRADITTLQPC